MNLYDWDSEALIIADIAGEYDAMERLVDRVDKKCPIMGVGDLVDRGPASSDVVSWFMKTKRANSVRGNHEDMMIDYVTNGGKYQKGVWLMNGGGYTLRSYDDHTNGVPKDHIDWLASRPLSLMIPARSGNTGCLITHAPIHRKQTLNEALFMDSGMDLEYSIIWNRTDPIKREWFQVFGHNSHWGLKKFEDEKGTWAICIDQSRKRVLTGFHWPSCEIFEEPYARN